MIVIQLENFWKKKQNEPDITDMGSVMIKDGKLYYNSEGVGWGNYKELTKEYVSKFDLLHLGALLDVLQNGDEALEKILSLSPKNILLGRMKLTDEKSYCMTYQAYMK